MAPSNRQNRLLRRPDWARVVLDTAQRYATPKPRRACVFVRDTPGAAVQLRTLAARDARRAA
ncbi:hypothetical protein NJB1604_27660 [Mycobacterium marinum]|nr:hypothetical protein NJB1604_27660 [Mycobacterium marinum]